MPFPGEPYTLTRTGRESLRHTTIATMKTTHQIARELLALPDVELVIEGWCQMDNHEMVAEITSYDENTAIIWQKPDPRLPARTEFHAPSGSWRWLNIPTQLPESPTP